MNAVQFFDWKAAECTRKNAYTEQTAIAKAAERSAASGLSIHAYLCHFSEPGQPHWHIGRKKRSKRQRALR